MEECRDFGDEHIKGSYTFGSFGTAQAIDIDVDGNIGRQNGHQAIQKLSWIEEEALLGQPSLDSGLFCQYDRYRRGNNTSACKVSRG